MINYEDVNVRGRIANSMSHWAREHDIFRMSRKELLMHYVGTLDFAKLLGINVKSKEMVGNLVQLGATANALQLAYGMPQFKLISQGPENLNTAERLQAALNRYMYLNDGVELARSLAMDSYFGWSICVVDQGLLPAAVRNATGMSVGPIARRISNDDFFFDGHATCLGDATWLAHTFYAPLDMARKFPGFNPEVAATLGEWSYTQQDSNTRSQVGVTSGQTAFPMTRLVSVYFPQHNCKCIWPANDSQFSGVRGMPLKCEEWKGHYTGPYEVAVALPIPDNLLPVAVGQSTLRLHTIFNALADSTSQQAMTAKYNPIFEVGSERDAARLTNAKDRAMTPVSNIQKIGSWQLPGPDPSQTQYMGAALQMFKEFSGNLDDALGTAPTAPTATQSQLIRQATSVRSADKRQRFQRMLANIATKLGHFFLNDPELFVPARQPIKGTDISVDMSWLPERDLPRIKNIDEFAIKVEPYSLEYRDPATRLAQLNEATQQIFQAYQIVQQGAPMDIEAFVELQANYRDLPELREVHSGFLPEYLEKKGNAQMATAKRADVGQYTRKNVSEQSNSGALAQNLAQSGGDNNQGGTGGIRV